MGVVHAMGLVVLNTPLENVKSFTCLPSSSTTACKGPRLSGAILTSINMSSREDRRVQLFSWCHQADIIPRNMTRLHESLWDAVPSICAV